MLNPINEIYRACLDATRLLYPGVAVPNPSGNTVNLAAVASQGARESGCEPLPLGLTSGDME